MEMTIRPLASGPEELSEQLSNLRELRRQGMPLYMVRHNQLCLWAWRQLRLHPELIHRPMSAFPGMQENWRKFVAIHYTAGNA